MPKRILTLLCVLILPILGRVEAGDLKPFAAGQDVKWQDNGNDERPLIDPNFSKCGQACLQNRGNENITLQANFMSDKYNFLMASVDEDHKRQVLGAFCYEKNGIKEDIDQCIARWIRVNEFWLMKVKGAIVKNQTSVSQLAGNICNDGGSCDADPTQNRAKAFAMSQANPNRIEYSASGAFSTAQELAEQAKQNMDTLMNNVRGDEEWVTTVSNELKPSEDDFIDYKPGPDPDHPGKTIMFPKLDAKGGLVKNKAAYQEALKKWQETFGDKTLLKTTLSDGKGIRKKTREEMDTFVHEFKMNPKSDQKSNLRHLYDESHDFIVEHANDPLLGKKEMAYGKQQGKRPQPGPSPSPFPKHELNWNAPGTAQIKYQQVNTNSGEKNLSETSVTYSPEGLQKQIEENQKDAKEVYTQDGPWKQLKGVSGEEP